MFQIVTFYEFKDMSTLGELAEVRLRLKEEMNRCFIKGTIILAAEGFNGSVSGEPAAIDEFVITAEGILNTTLNYKRSFHDERPFRRVNVKVKPEIVTLKKPVDIAKGEGTHLKPQDWNRIIQAKDVIVLDTRNDYEYRSGTFSGAVNPGTEKFSDLPAFVAENLDPDRHRKVAMFCTGGIRCEKFAPYMKELGFDEVYQLEGGILKYLEDVPAGESLWQGECFVFDDRVSVDRSLKKGSEPDHSQTKKSEQ